MADHSLREIRLKYGTTLNTVHLDASSSSWDTGITKLRIVGLSHNLRQETALDKTVQTTIDKFNAPILMLQAGAYTINTYAGGAVFSVERSGWVTAVAVVNFVLGGLQFFFGGCITFVAILFGDAFRQMMDEAIKEGLEIEPEMVEAMGAIIVGMAIAMLVSGVLSIAAGYGVSRRRPWGRILSLVLAGFTAFGVVLSLFDLDAESLFGIVIGLGYCALTFGVLCNPRYAAEFRMNV